MSMTPEGFFTGALAQTDPEVDQVMKDELERQQYQIELIASENIASAAVMEAQGGVMTNKYAEGYPGKRYYQGCVNVDKTEQLAIDRVCKLFGMKYANVQPHCGANANLAVFFATMEPGDTFLGMSLDAGGHLTHGAKPNFSGKWFNAVQFGVNAETGLIDYDEVLALAKEHKPKVIVSGFTCYPREIDWQKFREIADEVGAVLMADISHYSGLIAAGAYPSPAGIADVITSTTHKSLRGPRGGVIMTNDEEMAKKIDRAVFPGLQGGPLQHIIAAKAVAFGEALQPEFKDYSHAVVQNAKTLAETLREGGLDLVSGGTDSHVIFVDLRPKNLTGKVADLALEHAGLTTNKNAVPNDPEGPFVTSGLRLGTPAGTTRGFGASEWQEIGKLILEVLDGLVANGPEGNDVVQKDVKQKVKAL
ncbi:MAG: serine hydroxymethyltransferase, partial [Pseudomonadota bacterium]